MFRFSIGALLLAFALGGCSAASSLPQVAAAPSPTASPTVQITFTLVP